MAWVSWKKCKSKLYGGMGFRNLQAFNLALLAKQGWQILTHPNSLVARVYKAKYFTYDDILSSNIGSNPSYAWRSIHNSLRVLKEGLDGEWGTAKGFTFGKIGGYQHQPPTRWFRLKKILTTSQWSHHS